MKYHSKACLTPVSLQSVYLSTLYQFSQQNAKKNRTCMSTGKQISTASLKNCTDVSAPSARFSNFAMHSFLSSQLSKAKNLKVPPTKTRKKSRTNTIPSFPPGPTSQQQCDDTMNIRPREVFKQR